MPVSWRGRLVLPSMPSFGENAAPLDDVPVVPVPVPGWLIVALRTLQARSVMCVLPICDGLLAANRCWHRRHSKNTEFLSLYKFGKKCFQNTVLLFRFWLSSTSR